MCVVDKLHKCPSVKNNLILGIQQGTEADSTHFGEAQVLLKTQMHPQRCRDRGGGLRRCPRLCRGITSCAGAGAHQLSMDRGLAWCGLPSSCHSQSKLKALAQFLGFKAPG